MLATWVDLLINYIVLLVPQEDSEIRYMLDKYNSMLNFILKFELIYRHF